MTTKSSAAVEDAIVRNAIVSLVSIFVVAPSLIVAVVATGHDWAAGPVLFLAVLAIGATVFWGFHRFGVELSKLTKRGAGLAARTSSRSAQ